MCPDMKSRCHNCDPFILQITRRSEKYRFVHFGSPEFTCSYIEVAVMLMNPEQNDFCLHY